MIISCDTEGNIIVTRVSSVAFRIMTADKMYVLNAKIPTQNKPRVMNT